jgi:hypothetical protein
MEKPKSLAWLERHSITAVLQGHLMNRLQLYEISELAKLYALHVLHRVFRMLLPHFLATLPRTKISRKSEGLLVTFRASTAFRRRYSEVKWNPKQLQNKDMWNRDQETNSRRCSPLVPLVFQIQVLKKNVCTVTYISKAQILLRLQTSARLLYYRIKVIHHQLKYASLHDAFDTLSLQGACTLCVRSWLSVSLSAQTVAPK